MNGGQQQQPSGAAHRCSVQMPFRTPSASHMGSPSTHGMNSVRVNSESDSGVGPENARDVQITSTSDARSNRAIRIDATPTYSIHGRGRRRPESTGSPPRLHRIYFGGRFPTP